MGRLLTRAEKIAIRKAPCGECGAKPIIVNGEQCYPHRIIHRADGGEYTIDNVVPRCPSCHDVEHGGDGTAPFIGACRTGGLIGGRNAAIAKVQRRPAVHAKLKEKALLSWKDPARRTRSSAALKQAWTPERKAKARKAKGAFIKIIRVGLLKHWSNPEARKRMAVITKEAMSRPAVKARHRAAVLRSWQKRKEAAKRVVY